MLADGFLQKKKKENYNCEKKFKTTCIKIRVNVIPRKITTRAFIKNKTCYKNPLKMPHGVVHILWHSSPYSVEFIKIRNSG